jgi:hypothetical protein
MNKIECLYPSSKFVENKILRILENESKWTTALSSNICPQPAQVNTHFMKIEIRRGQSRIAPYFPKRVSDRPNLFI